LLASLRHWSNTVSDFQVAVIATVVGVAALIVAIVAVWYARSDTKNDRARRHEERTPKFAATIKRSGKIYELHLVLETQWALTKVQVYSNTPGVGLERDISHLPDVGQKQGDDRKWTLSKNFEGDYPGTIRMLITAWIGKEIWEEMPAEAEFPHVAMPRFISFDDL
jgi:hypothetical protein